MGLTELKAKLSELPPGESLGVHYVTFAELFPPGPTDQDAWEACRRFAEMAGCRADDYPALKSLFFVKAQPHQLNLSVPPPRRTAIKRPRGGGSPFTLQHWRWDRGRCRGCKIATSPPKSKHEVVRIQIFEVEPVA